MLSKKMATGGGVSSEVQRLASHAQAFDSIPVQLQKDERKEGGRRKGGRGGEEEREGEGRERGEQRGGEGKVRKEGGKERRGRNGKKGGREGKKGKWKERGETEETRTLAHITIVSGLLYNRSLSWPSDLSPTNAAGICSFS